MDVDDEEDDAEQDADGAHHQVSDAQERVLAAQPRGRRQDHLLRAVKRKHWERCNIRGIVLEKTLEIL